MDCQQAHVMPGRELQVGPQAENVVGVSRRKIGGETSKAHAKQRWLGD
jgi:hypothetical protein